MFRTEHIPLQVTGALNPLVKDYLFNSDKVKHLFSYYPDLNGINEAVKAIYGFDFRRSNLVLDLMMQANTVSNTSQKTRDNILLLNDSHTFTITTGHQLCLLTGPLYFIYKIFSVINITETLNEQLKEKKFVPVYWMATEDHDFEEINHFHLFKKKVEWLSHQKGAVGRFSTSELSSLSTEFFAMLGEGDHADELKQLFTKAYLEHNSLKDATRYLVNALFSEYGLVIVDGDDEKLKKVEHDIAYSDIMQNIPFQKVQQSSEAIRNLQYKPQVNPREINYFYLDNDLRARIEYSSGKYRVVDTDISFTDKELLQELNQHPEKFSPNVVTRPLYQQTLLPNLAYMGGPGELAYWLQYKSMFDELKTFFPVLIPRAFVTNIDKSSIDKIKKLNLSIEKLFSSENQLINEWMKEHSMTFSSEQESREIEKIFKELADKVGEIDKTLQATVLAEEQKVKKGLEMIEGKVTRSLKQKSETDLNRLKQARNKLLPEGEPQERVENFSEYYLKFGREWMSYLKEHLDPLSLQHHLILED